jgi:hypothetical protein
MNTEKIRNIKSKALVLIYGEHTLSDVYQASEYADIYDAVSLSCKSSYKGKDLQLPDDFIDAPDDTAPILMVEAYKMACESIQMVLESHYMVTASLGDDTPYTHLIESDSEDGACSIWESSMVVDEGVDFNIISCSSLSSAIDLK